MALHFDGTTDVFDGTTDVFDGTTDVFDGTTDVFDVETGRHEEDLIDYRLVFETVTYSTDGKFVAFVKLESPNTIQLYNAQTCSYLNTLEGHTGTVRLISFSPNNKVMASWCEDMSIRLWDTQTGTVRVVLETGDSQPHVLVFSPDSRFVATPSAGTIDWWDVGTGVRRQPLEMRDLVSFCAFSPDTRILAVLMHHPPKGLQKIDIWDLTTCRFTQSLRGYRGPATEVTFSPQNQFLAVTFRGHTVVIWSMTPFACVRTLGGRVDRVTAIKFSPDEQMIATGSLDKTVRVWEVTTGMLIQIVQYDAGFIRGISFSHREFVVSVSDDDLDSLCKVFKRTIWNEAVRNKALILKDYTYPITATQETATLEATLRREVGLSTDGTWITKGSDKIIWLPEDYRPRDVANVGSWIRRGSTLYIGCESGRVYRLQVS
ncbi:hypothetical protein ACHAPQ_002829 [Fusarium lateritium]